MALRLTLGPDEKVVINGCVVRNSNRRQVILIETFADIIRQKDLLKEDQTATPVTNVYFFIQTVILSSNLKDQLVPKIQEKLGKLAPIFEEATMGLVVEAANHVSAGDYYKALKCLRPVIKREAELIEIAKKNDLALFGHAAE